MGLGLNRHNIVNDVSETICPYTAVENQIAKYKFGV